MTAQPAALPVVDDGRLKRVAQTVRGTRTARRSMPVRGLDTASVTQLNERQHEQRRPQLDRELHLGHRRRRPARPLRAREVPRRDPAHDRAAPPRRRAGGQQAGRPRHEGRPRRRRRGRAGRRPAPTASNSPPTSRRTSTGFRPTCRTSSTTSSSAIRSRGCPAPTPWAR